MKVYDIDNEGEEMSSQDPSSDMGHQKDVPQDADRDNDALASKLSKELNNWRRRRTNGGPKRDESVKYQTESARTIKLRGHETLVVRKAKLVKPGVSQRPSH